MIQANVSGFVIGNCRGDEWVLGYKGFVEPADVPIEDWPGAPSEGRGWEAVSLPAAAHFDGSAGSTSRMAPLNRSSEPLHGQPMATRSHQNRRHAATYEHAEFIKRYNGTRALRPTIRTRRYDKLYISGQLREEGRTAGRDEREELLPSLDDPDKHARRTRTSTRTRAGRSRCQPRSPVRRPRQLAEHPAPVPRPPPGRR